MGRVSFGPPESCSWRVPLGERLYGYSGPWPVFAAFPPLAKSVLTKRNTKSRNKLSKRNKMHIKNHAGNFGVMAGRSAGTKKPLREGAGREAGLQFLKRPGRPSDCLVRRRAAMTFDGHLAPVRGLPDVGLHRNNLLSRLSLGHRTHLLFALVASAFTATEQKLGRPGPFKNCNPLCLFTSPSRPPRPRLPCPPPPYRSPHRNIHAVCR